MEPICYLMANEGLADNWPIKKVSNSPDTWEVTLPSVWPLGEADETPAVEGAIGGAEELDRATSAIFHLFHFGGDDDAVVVTTEVGHIADLFEGILPEDKGTGFHALES